MQKYGLELATTVATYLEKHWGIATSHRDYCGIGLWYEATDGHYFLAHFYDGYPELSEASKSIRSSRGYIKKFSQRAAFIRWLANCCDQDFEPYYNEIIFAEQLKKLT